MPALQYSRMKNVCENCKLKIKCKKVFDTNIVLLRIANFNKQQMIKQPIDWFVTVKHQNKLDDERQVIWLEQFTYNSENSATHW